MKMNSKCIAFIVAAAFLAGCGSKGGGVAAEEDLTKMSYVMAYAEVNKIKEDPAPYVGKSMKIDGTMAVYDYSYLSEEKKNYFCVSNLDNTGCCQITMEFNLAGGSLNPDDYPKTGDDVVVYGTIDTYKIKDFTYVYLKDAEVLK